MKRQPACRQVLLIRPNSKTLVPFSVSLIPVFPLLWHTLKSSSSVLGLTFLRSTLAKTAEFCSSQDSWRTCSSGNTGCCHYKQHVINHELRIYLWTNSCDHRNHKYSRHILSTLTSLLAGCFPAEPRMLGKKSFGSRLDNRKGRPDRAIRLKSNCLKSRRDFDICLICKLHMDLCKALSW